MKSIFEPNSDPVIVPSASTTGTLEVFWTADERLTSPYRWNYYYRYDASFSAAPTLESLRGLDHAQIMAQAQGSGFTVVTKRPRDLHLRWIAQLDTISRTPVEGRPIREWLRFEGISLWQFLPEVCYSDCGGSIAGNRRIDRIPFRFDRTVPAVSSGPGRAMERSPENGGLVDFPAVRSSGGMPILRDRIPRSPGKAQDRPPRRSVSPIGRRPAGRHSGVCVLAAEDSAIRESHRMRYLFLPEIQQFTRDAGLEFLGACEWLTDKAPGLESWSVACIAQLRA